MFPLVPDPLKPTPSTPFAGQEIALGGIAGAVAVGPDAVVLRAIEHGNTVGAIAQRRVPVTSVPM